MSAPARPLAMRDAFLGRLHEAMQRDDSLFLLTADFGSPVIDRIRRDKPERFVNVGIAEQNLVNVAAGLALEGFTVFAYAIAPFITMRCYEQIRVSLALLSVVRPINVNLVGVGAGYSYVVSGPTHQCYEDLTLMRALPNVEVYSPSDHLTTAALFDRCTARARVKYLRLDAQPLPVLGDDPGSATGFRMLRTGDGPCLVGTGYATHTLLKVADRLAERGVFARVLDVVDVTGFDRDAFRRAVAESSLMISVEEGFVGRGGLDAALRVAVEATGMRTRHVGLGVDPAYRFELGSRTAIHEKVGIGPEGLLQTITGLLESEPSRRT